MEPLVYHYLCDTDGCGSWYAVRALHPSDTPKNVAYPFAKYHHLGECVCGGTLRSVNQYQARYLKAWFETQGENYD